LNEKILAVRRRVLGEEHPETLTSMHNLGIDLYVLGEVVAAKELILRVYRLRFQVLSEQHPDTVNSQRNLAIIERRMDEEDPDTLERMTKLANAVYVAGDAVGARELHESVLAVRRRVLGEEHPDTLQSMNNLAAIERKTSGFGSSESS
ncbi:tetratricopeptide repeat protein, partial [Actinoplanes cyaneus]